MRFPLQAIDPARDDNAVRWVREQRRKLWERMHDFVSAHGARIVSLPNVSPIRIEISPTNTILRERLTELGYVLYPGGQVSVFAGKGFEQYDILVVDLE
jgi:hypothetical protein